MHVMSEMNMFTGIKHIMNHTLAAANVFRMVAEIMDAVLSFREVWLKPVQRSINYFSTIQKNFNNWCNTQVYDSANR